MTPPRAGSVQDLGLADRAIDGAINVFREALQVAPDDPKTLGNLGNALLAQASDWVGKTVGGGRG